MKRYLLNDFFHNHFLKALLVFLLSFCASGLQAQIQNNGIIYLNKNAFLYTRGTFVFGNNSQTKTYRDAGFGKLIFGPSSSTLFAATGSTLFTDGFTSTRKVGYFELPTGQGTLFAPIGVTTSSITNGVDAAYYEGALSNSDFNPVTINTLPTAGYWVVKGDDAALTLKWNNDIGSLTNSIANLTVAGFSTTTSKWEVISSDSPIGNLYSGSIKTSGALSLLGYSAFTLAERKISCASLIAASGSTIHWTGTGWDNITGPTLADAVVLDGNYPSSGLSFACNSLAIGNNNVVLTDGKSIEVVNGISGTGTITMSSTASVLQRNDGSTITPNIVLTKSSRANMRANDYIYWGSPLNSDTFSQLNGARAFDASNVLVPGSTAAFDLKYKYVSGGSPTVSGWQTLTATEKGKGFIMRIKNQAPYSASTGYDGHINLSFSGVTNNGEITVSTSNIYSTNPTSAKNNNLLSNPYPSAIDADKFLEYNTNLDGVVYLWKAQTPNVGTVQAYVNADYIAHTRAGSTAYGGIGGSDFDGKIATGQGFKVKDLSVGGSGIATFNNCMRVSGNNTQFMRMNSSAFSSSINRFKVNIMNSSGLGNQVLVAYMPEASLAYDRMYDASLYTVSAVQMYSILDDDTKKLAINARPDFHVNDQVKVGYNVADSNPTLLSINVAQREGIFSDASTPIYLYDSILNVYHDFNNGAYSFMTASQQDNDRFKIVYQTALDNEQFDSNTAVAVLNENTLQISASLNIKQVSVYDMMGRLVMTNSPTNLERSFVAPFYHAEGIYIVKVKLDNGSVASQKLINKK